MKAFLDLFPGGAVVTYGVNVALHGLGLSVLGWVMLRTLRAAARRSFVAALWLLLATVGPWFTAASLPQAKQEVVSPPNSSVAAAVAVPSFRPSLIWTIPIRVEHVAAAAEVSSVDTGPTVSITAWPTLLSVIMMIWGTGAALFLLRRLWDNVRLLRWRHGLRPLPGEERARIESLTGMTLPSNAALFEEHGSPCVVGGWRPVLAVPACALADWTPAEWRWVLSHEGRHLSGSDTTLSGLLTLLRCLWWWNPFVHLLLEGWEAAREEVCDLASIREPAEAPAYASFLLRLAQAGPALHPAGVSMARPRPAAKLRHRITAILHGKGISTRMTWRYAAGSIAWAGAVAAVLSCAGIKAEASDDNVAAKVSTRSRSQLSASDAAPSRNNVRVYVQTRWIESDTAGKAAGKEGNITDAEYQKLIREEGVISDPQYQKLIRELSQRRASLFTKRAITWIGQKTSLDEIREMDPAINGKSPPAAPSDFTGIKTEVLVELSGDQLQVNFTADVCDHEDDLVSADRNTFWQNPAVAHLRRSTTAVMGNDGVLLVRMGEIKRGRAFFCFLTVNTIDPSSREAISVKEAIHRAENLEGRPVPPVSTKSVKVSVQVADSLVKESEYSSHFGWLVETTLPSETEPGRTPRLPRGKIVGDFSFFPHIPWRGRLTSVLSPARVEALQRKIKGHADTTSYVPPAVTVQNDQRAEFEVHTPKENIPFFVNPAIGVDGDTIDLRVGLPCPGKNKSFSTEVSVFDGQTIIVSGVVNGDLTGAGVNDESYEKRVNLHRMYIITAKIVE